MTDPTAFPPHEAPHQTPSHRPVPGERLPDLGTPISRVVAIVAVTLLYLFLSVMQNLSPYLTPKEDPLGRKPRGGEVAKFILLLNEAFTEAGMASGELGAMAAEQYASPDLHPTDRLQAVLVVGETGSGAEALKRLDTIREGAGLRERSSKGGRAGESAETAPAGSERWAFVKNKEGWGVDRDAVADAEAMDALYRDGAGALSDEQRTRLKDRYGWLGELALTHGEPADSASRAALFEDIPWAIALILIVFAVLTVAVLGGLTMFIIATVMFFSGRLKRRFVPPAHGGSVYLETFAVFLAAFGVLHIGAGIVAGVVGDEPWLMPATMLAQWSLIITLCWACVRGVPTGRWRDAVGWRAPQGVGREVAAGIAGYFAGLPLLLGAMAFTVLINLVASELFGGPEEPPSNPVLELVKDGDALTLIVFVSLATVWAPIVEETIFRGAVYRHLRGRIGAFLAACFTALLFAFMHSYGPLMTAPLIALGFSFAMIREWRGSLIGSMTAHCLHNSTIMVILMLGLKVMA